MLARRLIENENKFKGTKATLEEVQDQLRGEKAGVAMLQTSLNELKEGWEVEKKKVTEDMVAAYLKS